MSIKQQFYENKENLLTRICYENNGFILEFWSDAANYGIMRLDMVNDIYTFEEAFERSFCKSIKKKDVTIKDEVCDEC